MIFFYNFFSVEVDAESGTARGLDFQFVCNIINFDFPQNVTSYIHRVGRTARGNNQGTALSMVSVKENDTYNGVSRVLNRMMLGDRYQEVESQTNEDGVFKNYCFDLSQLDGFR